METGNNSGAVANRSVDVLIVGSGICGSVYLRVIADALPDAHVLMVEAGPGITNVPGMNVKNIVDDAAREQAQIASQGPTQFAYEESVSAVDDSRASEIRQMIELARPGTFLVDTTDAIDFPAGAASSNVGGMGAHWTCACPTPDGPERIPFIERSEMDRLLAKARELLAVHEDIFEASAANRDMLERLERSVPQGARPVGPMPMACRISEIDGSRIWSGPDTILGDLGMKVASGIGPQKLLSNTVALEVMWEDESATGALLLDLASGSEFVVDAKVVIVAADSLRTPQLLWNSRIRPEALGCYLNEHPQVLAAVSYVPPPTNQPLAGPDSGVDIGVFWVPFDDASHPFHGQVLPRSVSPIPIAHPEAADPGLTIALSWFCRKEIHKADRVAFSETEKDFLGLPEMHIHYSYSDQDHRTIRAATATVRKAAAELGTLLEGEEPRLLAAGRSLHYQGTVRMGEVNDGTCVCDSSSCVWKFRNLFVAGNGVIPTSTACNPTLTGTALAVRGAERVIKILAPSADDESEVSARRA